MDATLANLQFSLPRLACQLRIFRLEDFDIADSLPHRPLSPPASCRSRLFVPLAIFAPRHGFLAKQESERSSTIYYLWKRHLSLPIANGPF